MAPPCGGTRQSSGNARGPSIRISGFSGGGQRGSEGLAVDPLAAQRAVEPRDPRTAGQSVQGFGERWASKSAEPQRRRPRRPPGCRGCFRSRPRGPKVTDPRAGTARPRSRRWRSAGARRDVGGPSGAGLPGEHEMRDHSHRGRDCLSSHSWPARSSGRRRRALCHSLRAAGRTPPRSCPTCPAPTGADQARLRSERQDAAG